MTTIDFILNSKIQLINGEDQVTEGIIHDVVDDKVFVATTYDDKKTKLLRVGDMVKGVVFNDIVGTAFDAVVSDRRPGEFPIYVISNMRNFEEIQRRNDIRVPCTLGLNYTTNKYMANVDIKYVYEHFDELQRYFKEAMMIDLSGGGLRFTSTEKIDENQRVLFNLTIDNNNFLVEGDILHRISGLAHKQTMYSYGVRFVDLDERKRERIISYLFVLMRKNRVK